MKLTAIIHPDSETDLLVAECSEIGTASQGHTEAEASPTCERPPTFTLNPSRKPSGPPESRPWHAAECGEKGGRIPGRIL
jgi:hypothetical protein